MLVLGRKEGGKIVMTWCGERIGTITICQIHGKYVRLGFDFDRHVNIVREEVLPKAAEAATEPPFGLGLPVELWDSQPLTGGNSGE